MEAEVGGHVAAGRTARIMLRRARGTVGRRCKTATVTVALGRGWRGGHRWLPRGAAPTSGQQLGSKLAFIEPHKQAAAIVHVRLVVKVALDRAQLLGGPRGHDSFPAIGRNAFVIDNCLNF